MTELLLLAAWVNDKPCCPICLEPLTEKARKYGKCECGFWFVRRCGCGCESYYERGEAV